MKGKDVTNAEGIITGIKECPFDKQPHLKPVKRFCDDCMVTHFPVQCSNNPSNGTQTKQHLGNAPLSAIQVIPLRNEDEMLLPNQVVTRAQAKENIALKLEEPEPTLAKRENTNPRGREKLALWLRN